jgi:hypothetical protein
VACVKVSAESRDNPFTDDRTCNFYQCSETTQPYQPYHWYDSSVQSDLAVLTVRYHVVDTEEPYRGTVGGSGYRQLGIDFVDFGQ